MKKQAAGSEKAFFSKSGTSCNIQVRETCPIFQLPRILFGLEGAEDGWMKIRVTSPLKIWNLLLMTPFPQETLIQEMVIRLKRRNKSCFVFCIPGGTFPRTGENGGKSRADHGIRKIPQFLCKNRDRAAKVLQLAPCVKYLYNSSA